MIFCRIASVFLLSFLAIGSPASVRAEDFPMQEYEEFVGRYIASIENLGVDFVWTYSAFDGSETYRDEFSLISIPGHFRVKIVMRTKKKDGRESSRTKWALLRPDGYYSIEEKPEARFLLISMEKKSTSALLVSDIAVSTLTHPVHQIDYPINRLIRGDLKPTHSVTVMDFQRRAPNSAAAFVLRTSNVINKGRSETKYELNDRWLVAKLSGMSNAVVRFKREITYTMLGDRMLPERITQQNFEESGRPMGPAAVAEFRNYKIYNGRPADFSLAQFGLPETSSAYRDGSRWYLWFLAFALSSLGIGWYFRRRARLRAFTPAPSAAKSGNGRTP